VRSLAQSIAPGDAERPAFAGLGLTVAAAGVLEPDEIARVLDASHRNGALPTVDNLRLLRESASAWGRQASARLFVEAAESAAAFERLLSVALMWSNVGAWFDQRIPMQINQFGAALRRRLIAVSNTAPPPRRPTRSARAPARPTALRPRAEAAAPVEPAPTPEPPPMRRRPDAHVPLHPPVPHVQGAPSMLPLDPRLAPLHLRSIGGGLRLVLPRTDLDLAAWGRTLHNCLDTYATAVHRRLSFLIGVEVAGTLTYCVELAPDGRVRQFLGSRNRPPPAPHEQRVRAVVAEAFLSER